MKKLVLLLSFLIAAKNGFSQNWSGVVTNKYTHIYKPDSSSNNYQINYLIVDTAYSSGSDSTFEFYKMPRHSTVFCQNFFGPEPNFIGPSWLGWKMIRTSIGEELYENQNEDTIVIKNQTPLNGSWIMTIDSSGISYEATVISINEMMLNNAMDSVKTIRINSYQGGNAVGSLYNNVEFTLSKQNGFVDFLPMYEFPYQVVIPMPKLIDSSSSLFSFLKGRTYHDGDLFRSVSRTSYPEYYTPGDTAEFVVTFDSVMSIVNLGNGSFDVNLERTTHTFSFGNGLKSNLNTTISIVTITTDNLPTINIIAVKNIMNSWNDHLDYSLIPSLAFNRNNYFYRTTDCGGDTLLGYGSGDGFEGGSLVQYNFPDSCITYAIPLGGNYAPRFETYKEGVGLIYSIDADPSTLSYEYSNYYNKVNGCESGNRFAYNFGLSASQFEANVTRLNASQLNVTWNTMNESNVAHFEIERSYDAVQFSKIGKQNSKGGNFASNNYSYIDDTYAKELNGFVYYRIKMIDIDGKIFFSNVAKYELGSNHSVVVNGTIFSNQIQLSNLELNSSYQIQLMDAIGRKVYQTKVDDNKSNTFQIVGMSHLPQGIYFLNIVNVEQGKKENFKLIKTN